MKTGYWAICLLVASAVANKTTTDIPEEYDFECFKCKDVFREGPNCVQSYEECEDCLEGYDEPENDNESSGDDEACVKSPGPFQCSAHEPCGPGFFCFKEKFCLPCQNCSEFLRLEGKVCSDDINDCGSCLPGNEIVPVRNNSYTICQPHIHVVISDCSSYRPGIIILSVTAAIAAGFVLAVKCKLNVPVRRLLWHDGLLGGR